MSSNIWTQCARKFKFARFSGTVWRIVEDQYRNTTRKLVDSDAEQILLENLLEDAKPALPSGLEWKNLHYLLSTPFRYASRYGSRFRAPGDAGVWYGSLTLETAIAETAFQRLRFLNDTEAELTLDVILTAFSARLYSSRGVDLTKAPFQKFEKQISDSFSYRETQPLGSAMRQAGAELCEYTSVRDIGRGKNTAVFTPRAFADRNIPDRSRETLSCFGERRFMEISWLRFSGAKTFRFERRDFEVGGKFPLMKD